MYPILYRKTFRTGFCVGLILFALALRLIMAPGLLRRLQTRVTEVLSGRALFSLVVFLETGTWVSVREDPVPPDGMEPTAADSVAAAPSPETDPLKPDTPVPAGIGETAPFTAAEAEAIRLRGNCDYTVDKTALLLRPLDWQQSEGPRILIIHTHSCESYTQSDGCTYLPSGNYRTLDAEASVIAVGDALTEELGKRGIQVIHDRTLNDYPSYNRSYAVAREKIQTYLDRYPSIVMVLDIHRDALEEPVREAAEIDGVTCARLMLVVGTDEGGLEHPHWQDNLSCALKLQALANRSTPDLFRDISFRQERFNGDLTPGSLIVEVGSTGNTLPEALSAMPLLADYLSQLLALE